LGLSLLSGAHLVLVPRVVDLLKAAGREDVLLIVGGIIPDDDIAPLEAGGVAQIFTPGASLAEIGSWLESALDAREAVQ
jgi:methylmalonyl-CoA mutase C-terminal domain/subunit